MEFSRATFYYWIFYFLVFKFITCVTDNNYLLLSGFAQDRLKSKLDKENDMYKYFYNYNEGEEISISCFFIKRSINKCNMEWQIPGMSSNTYRTTYDKSNSLVLKTTMSKEHDEKLFTCYSTDCKKNVSILFQSDCQLSKVLTLKGFHKEIEYSSGKSHTCVGEYVYSGRQQLKLICEADINTHVMYVMKFNFDENKKSEKFSKTKVMDRDFSITSEDDGKNITCSYELNNKEINSDLHQYIVTLKYVQPTTIQLPSTELIPVQSASKKKIKKRDVQNITGEVGSIKINIKKTNTGAVCSSEKLYFCQENSYCKFQNSGMLPNKAWCYLLNRDHNSENNIIPAVGLIENKANISIKKEHEGQWTCTFLTHQDIHTFSDLYLYDGHYYIKSKCIFNVTVLPKVTATSTIGVFTTAGILTQNLTDNFVVKEDADSPVSDSAAISITKNWGLWVLVAVLAIFTLCLCYYCIVRRRRQNKEVTADESEDVTYENLSNLRQFPPNLESHYGSPVDRIDEESPYSVPYVEKDLDKLYAKPTPKNQRQIPMQELYSQVVPKKMRKKEILYADIEVTSSNKKKNIEKNEEPMYSEIQKEGNYANLNSKQNYDNVFNDRYVNAHTSEYAEPAYFELRK